MFEFNRIMSFHKNSITTIKIIMFHLIFCCTDKQVPVPSIYFIGKTGTPLEIITDVKDAKELQEKISVVLEKHGVKEVVLNQRK